jgi:hypothetical protein
MPAVNGEWALIAGAFILLEADVVANVMRLVRFTNEQRSVLPHADPVPDEVHWEIENRKLPPATFAGWKLYHRQEWRAYDLSYRHSQRIAEFLATECEIGPTRRGNHLRARLKREARVRLQPNPGEDPKPAYENEGMDQ